MRVPKPRLHKLLRSMDKRSRLLSRRQDVARMPSLPDFLSEDEAAIDGGAGNSGTDAAKLRMKPWKVTSCLPGGFQTPSFSG